MATKILVVDDEQVILELTSLILQNQGYEVIVARGGQEGLEKARQAQPELILLDYMMPEQDGMMVLQQVRQELPESYVIIFTGKGSEEVAVEVMKAGASDYVLKPFNNQNLLERIENVLHIREIELQNRALEQERQRLQEEIKAWNQELEQRVEDKSRELEQAYAGIIQAEKLATLGHLAAGMAHEIRNPLNSIGLFAQILDSGVQDNPELAGYTGKILTEVERIDDLLRKLLSASKAPQGSKEAVDLSQVAAVVLDRFSGQIERQNVALHRQLESHQPTLSADPSEIEQIFTNLIMNALYALPEDDGRLEVRVGQQHSWVHVEIADSGSGIPPEHLKRIYEPFYTTKSKGTGFGLSVVLRIVKTYGGHIAVDSAPGEGTRFYIDIPLTRDAPGEKA